MAAQQLLGTVLPGNEQRVGTALTHDEEAELRGLSKPPLRFWAWGAPWSGTPSSKTPEGTASQTTTPSAVSQLQKQQPTPTKTWRPTQSLARDLSSRGPARGKLRRAWFAGFQTRSKARDLLLPILATLRMVAKNGRYRLALPHLDVLEKTALRGPENAQDQHPSGRMGQLAEAMGYKPRWGR